MVLWSVQASLYIHERQKCTRKCMTWKETVNVKESTVLTVLLTYKNTKLR
jgi:hypothetical protein